MSQLKTIERKPFEDLFEMETGYVCNFSNATFASFFLESVGKDIYDTRYGIYGNSKAKRLRAFWDLESNKLVSRILSEMLDVWEYDNPIPTETEKAKLQSCRAIVDKLVVDKNTPIRNHDTTESQFMHFDYSGIKVRDVPIESRLIPILESRFKEAINSLESGCCLSAIFMCGSILEGLLLGTALANPRLFNQYSSSPKKKDGKVRQFHEWTLAQLIDVASGLGYLKPDVRKFSHAMRDFRNYIHPFQQMSTGFAPDQHTAEICMQVLRAAIASLVGVRR